MFVALICGAFGLIYFYLKKNWRVFIIVVFSFTGLLFWLLNSPDYRFGFPYIISMIAVVILPVVNKLMIGK